MHSFAAEGEDGQDEDDGNQGEGHAGNRTDCEVEPEHLLGAIRKEREQSKGLRKNRREVHDVPCASDSG